MDRSNIPDVDADRLDPREAVGRVRSKDWSDGWDRLTYLLGEYKIPVSAAAVALAILFSAGEASIPSPPPIVVQQAEATLVIAVPGFVLMKVALIDRIYDPPIYYVAERDGETKDKIRKVPKQLWREREVDNYDAWRPHGWQDDDNVDYAVRDFDWHEDVGQIVVEGLPPRAPKPEEAETHPDWIPEIYDYYLEEADEADRLRSEIQGIAHRVRRQMYARFAAIVGKATAVPRTDPVSDLLDDVNLSRPDRPRIEDVDRHREAADQDDLDVEDDQDVVDDVVDEAVDGPEEVEAAVAGDGTGTVTEVDVDDEPRMADHLNGHRGGDEGE